jgi:putative nucleotidyltransferase with HDIG domain
VCFPIQTPRRSYGGLWLEMNQSVLNNPRSIRELNNLVRQASLALERSILLKETRAQAEQLSHAVYDLERAYDHTLMSLISALEARDQETEGHSVRVAQLAIAIGEMIGLAAEELKALERGALLHDIGKIGISDSILLKKGPLDEEEWGIMRQHPAIGARIIAGVPFLRDSSLIIASHQERWDGSGYPFGLKGEGIPLLARIFAVADVFDALISERPYHQKMEPKAALEYLCTQANVLFEPYIVKVLVDLYHHPNLMQNLGFTELEEQTP